MSIHLQSCKAMSCSHNAKLSYGYSAMSLFHPRVIERHIKHVPPLPEEQTRILTSWAENLAGGVYDIETQHDSEFIQQILINVLGYTGSINGDFWTVAKNEAIGRGNVDVALGTFTTGKRKVIAPFELKGAKTKDLDAVMSGRNKTPVQQAWEYAMDAKGAQWVLVSNYREIRLYAVGYGRKDYELFDLSSANLSDSIAKMRLLISAENLLGGKTRRFLEESEETGKAITADFYADHKALRERLISSIGSDNPRCERLVVIRLAQKILDRILFVAFAEDMALLPKNTLANAYHARNKFSPQPVWDSFRGLFQAIDRGSVELDIPQYNGGLFSDDQLMDSLIVSDVLCESFRKIGDYDFGSDVTVNILGHIFEQSIDDLEELKADAISVDQKTENIERRKKEGIFYTPAQVTRYIVEEAVGGWLRDRKSELGFDKLPTLTEDDFNSIRVLKRGKRKQQVTYNKKIARHVEAWTAYQEALSGIKILDPACGSGAFLTEVFDYLKAEGDAVNAELAMLKGEQTSLFEWRTHILANNIYGVDLNRESVEITKLSLWLKTANRQEKLTYLENNIRVGNSLISDPSVAGELAFDWEFEFAEIMQAGGFDVVVGNPPYIDSETMTKNQPLERDHIASVFSSTRGNWDIYIAFFELGLRKTKPTQSYLTYITPDKWISKDFGDQLRLQFTPLIRKLLVFGRDVFDDANVDAVVTTFKRCPSETIRTAVFDGSREELLNEMPINELTPPYKLDVLFSRYYPLIAKVERASNVLLESILKCENACATADAYKLKQIVAEGNIDNDDCRYYRVCNTGTLDKYVFKWGRKSMRYLKDSYRFPVVNRDRFHELFGATYVGRSSSPKIVIKGLTLLDCALDLNGSFIPGKSTLIIKSDDIDLLKTVCAFLNSKLIIFLIKQKYASSSYNGGINFTKEMVNNLPFPSSTDLKQLCDCADASIEVRNEIAAYSMRFLSLLRNEFDFEAVPASLERWYLDDFKKFYSKVEKHAKVKKLTLSEKADWMQYFEDQKVSALKLDATIRSVDEAINNHVYDLFGLTPEEIDLVEKVV